jgi:hypothetical protein
MTTRPSLHTAATIALAALLAAPLARAESTEPAAETTSGGFAPAATDAASSFGAVGQLALSIGATNGEHFFFHKSGGGGWQLEIAPAADYFFYPHVSVGGIFAYGHDSGGGGAGTSGLGSDSISIGARAGYALAFNDKFGVWPLAGIRLDYRSANHASSTDTFIPLYVPVLFHPAPHFFAGLGPNVQFHLSGQGNGAWGIDSMLGGWF